MYSRCNLVQGADRQSVGSLIMGMINVVFPLVQMGIVEFLKAVRL